MNRDLSPLWCAVDTPHGAHSSPNKFGGVDYCTGRFEQVHAPNDDERVDLDELEAMIEGAYDLRHVPVYPIRAMIRELRARRIMQGEP